VQLFHYHLVTSRVREVEARYVGKLGFNLVARHGRIGEEYQSFEPGVSWENLDRLGFKLRLTELERGGVNVVVQPGQWEVPRVDHLGLALDEDEFEDVLARAMQRDLRVQAHGGRRTFVATNAGYRLEIHPPREWLEELLAAWSDFALGELQLLAEDPVAKADALASLLDLETTEDGSVVDVGSTRVRFMPAGPPGRPQLHAELFL
jgi:catechol 2,3-dioxygenase-like lactoylglutathione lyase family enzyme